MVIFGLQLQKNTKKTRRRSQKEIKKRLIDTIVNNDIIETEELNEKADRVEKPNDGTDIIKQYEDIIHTKKEGIISIAYHEGKVFKRFKDKEKFIRLVMESKVHRNTIIFQTNIFKLIDKHPKLRKSPATLGFLKNYYKDSKQLRKENSST